MYQIAGKTGTAQVKSIAQGKRYNEALLQNVNLITAYLLALHPLKNLKLQLLWFGKMAVMVVRQLKSLNLFLTIGY